MSMYIYLHHVQLHGLSLELQFVKAENLNVKWTFKMIEGPLPSSCVILYKQVTRDLQSLQSWLFRNHEMQIWEALRATSCWSNTKHRNQPRLMSRFLLQRTVDMTASGGLQKHENILYIECHAVAWHTQVTSFSASSHCTLLDLWEMQVIAS